MKTRKTILTTVITAGLLLSSTAFADSSAQEAYEYTHAYFNKVKDPHTLAGAIYTAMKKDPVAATAAYRAFMIDNTNPLNSMNQMR